ncbi:MAG: Gfo/Idh/MocA family oxidoreductase [Bacteroidota bacterium]|nr:oxidoreductase [Odoribacter sp.]MDP3644458.1 Gfo/Idh/MocA family oxidoreductase [Bacteroidota bacterium]
MMTQKSNTPGIPDSGSEKKNNPNLLDRRKFIGGISTAALAMTVVPRHVLGGNGFVAPSDKITLAYIGTGTQGLRELQPLLSIPELQIVAVCDPQKYAFGYYDWGKTGLRDEIRKTLQNPNWTSGGDQTVPGGLDNGKEIVDTYYSKFRADQKFRSCAAYADFREMFEKEKDLNAVKVMTPDHLHGVIALAAMKRGISVTTHKPISNRLEEGFQVIETAKKSKATTHLIAWDSNGSMDQVMKWINEGAIGALKEVHNWSNRPVWPQYPTLPTDTPPVPNGMDWDLWLGPEAERPYHPYYTNMVFRGWYDFGGGSMADMGHYSLWTVFKALGLENPTIVEPTYSHVCGLRDSTAFRVKNDFSFPFASSVRIKYPAKGSRPKVDLIWYDGGMRPLVPEELYEDNKELQPEGMMFVGDKGKILAGFHVNNPQLIPEKRMVGQSVPELPKKERTSGFLQFMDAVKAGKQCPGSFTEAWSLTEAVNLYGVALRTGRILKYDATNRKITNVADADKYLGRVYRNGWDPGEI